ncbi:hypothetical protein QQX09_07265 [Demequina sp. SYSU T00192]|uniref:Integral membrane protein n=1 Tax=Demequina litoralis TaxID=3051660 RepID=A0ABT8G931_9MICO|nr:hypothetical protein [Demequina sp. SYSU T00192]MDN4475650.1 hypothetical protein [Demequina sp. SYSU T00192]
MERWSTRTRVAWWIAVGWGALLPLLALAVPVGTEVSLSSDGIETTRHLTLAQAEGVSGVLTVAVPLALVLLVGAAMAAPGRWGLPAAWALFGLLAAANLLAMMSVGIVVVPLTVAVLVALVGRTNDAPRSRASSGEDVSPRPAP